MRRFMVLAGVVALAAGSLVVMAVPAGATDVSDEVGLRAAFDSDAQVDLLNDIALSDCGAGDLDRSAGAPVVLDGHGHVITQTCPDNIIDDSGTFDDITLRNVTLTGGRDIDDGGAIDMNGGNLTVINSTLAGNCTADSAGAIENEDGDTTIIASTLSGNLAERQGGALRSKRGATTLVNSTVTGNTQRQLGAVDSGQPTPSDASLTLIYDTIVGNENVAVPPNCDTDSMASEADDGDIGDDAGLLQFNPANVNAVGTFSAFGTVIALPSGGPNCDFPSTTSQGFNYSDDDSCVLAGTGDRQSAGDPLLGALAGNGGPTQTRLPQAGSALIDAIPNVNCGDGDTLAGFAITNDQRGLARPEQTGGKCDIGAVEVQLPPVVVLQPKFTG